MKRSTRKSAVFLPPIPTEVEQKRIPGGGFDTKFSLPSFTRRVEKLTDDQRVAINKTGFGNLLKIHNQMVSKVLLDVLMERWDSEKMTFKLLHRELTITPQDVALILGLRVVGKLVALDGPFSDLEMTYGATPSNRKISISVIEDRLESMGGSANEDFVRCFLLYTFGVFLFPNSAGKVNSVYLTLLEDLDKVSEYAWGEAVRQDLFSWFKKRTEENVRSVGGCLFLLQVWSYEHIDIGRPNLIASEQFPRASRWESRSSFQRQWLCTRINKLEEDQITWELHPTTSESEIDVVKHFLDVETPKEESSGISKCEESVTECHPKTQETVRSQKDLRKNMQFIQEVVSQAESGITQSFSETKETAESPYTQNPDLEGVEMEEDLASEVSGASLDIPLEVSESPEISRYNDQEDRLPILSQRLTSLHIQELKELRKEIDMVKKVNSKLEEENLKLKEENLRLEEENTELRAESEVSERNGVHVYSTIDQAQKGLSDYISDYINNK